MGITVEKHFKLLFMFHTLNKAGQPCEAWSSSCSRQSIDSPSLSFKRHQTASHYTLITVLFYYAVSEVCIRFPSKSSVLFHN